MNNTKILCHRGIHKNIIENTLESFIEVNNYKNNNYKIGIEFDIQITKNNTIICYHDDNLLRIHNINQNTYDLLDDDIDKLNISKFVDVLQKLKDMDIFLDIEIKDIGNNFKLCDEIINIMNSEKIDNYIITSFNDNIIDYILHNSSLNCGLIIRGDINPDFTIINNYINLGLKAIIIYKNRINIFDQFKDKLDIYIYTIFNDIEVDDSKIIQECIKNGINIITDDIDKTIENINIK